MKILVTGGSRGIGASIVQTLQQEHDVIAPTSDELDLSSADSVKRYCDTFPKVDAVINNAGINIIKPISDVTDEEIERLNNINYLSPLKLCRAAIPNMQSQGFGRIINISSIWGVRSLAERGLYSGSKTALIGLTRALARELGEDNILVNAVCPGFIDTELTQRSLTPEAREKLLSQVPLKRLGKPREISNLVRFLVSQDNSYITGQALVKAGVFTA